MDKVKKNKILRFLIVISTIYVGYILFFKYKLVFNDITVLDEEIISLIMIFNGALSYVLTKE